MKTHVPVLNISNIVHGEDLSPKSEDLREGIETKQFPFLFQTNRNCSNEGETFRVEGSINPASPEKDPNFRIMELQQREIVDLKEQNRVVQKKIESVEREVKSLKRLRILLREKDRRIKELEESISSISSSSTPVEQIFDSSLTASLVTSQEFYKLNPPKRVWQNPVPCLYSQLESLAATLHSLHAKS